MDGTASPCAARDGAASMSVSQAYTLRGQIRALETTTQVTLGGARPGERRLHLSRRARTSRRLATTVFFGAVIYSTSVSVAIYAFWSYLLRFMPMCASRAAGGFSMSRWRWRRLHHGHVLLADAAALAGSAAWSSTSPTRPRTTTEGQRRARERARLAEPPAGSPARRPAIRGPRRRGAPLRLP